MSSEEAAARPERIGKYRIVGTLGRGAMGRVYLGEDPHIGRKVAVKVLAGATGEEARSRFLEEARTIGHLSHPEIVTLLEFGFHEGQPFLVMEHLEGESFGRWLAQAPPERRVLEALQALCRAVAYAHGQGVLHRDIKPSNLQVLGDGRTKLLDFGIARSGAVALTATGMLMGTPQYLAPEVLEGKGHSRASDVYAVALVVYEALAGVSPFAADSLEQCLKRVLVETPKPLAELRPDLDPELARAVAVSMSKAPEDRPTTVEPLLEALGHALDRGSGRPDRPLDRPTVRLSEETVQGAERPSRPRRPGLRVAAALLALAAVGTAGWLALSSDRPPEAESAAVSTPGRPFEEEIAGDPPSPPTENVDEALPETRPLQAQETGAGSPDSESAEQTGAAEMATAPVERPEDRDADRGTLGTEAPTAARALDRPEEPAASESEPPHPDDAITEADSTASEIEVAAGSSADRGGPADPTDGEDRPDGAELAAEPPAPARQERAAEEGTPPREVDTQDTGAGPEAADSEPPPRAALEERPTAPTLASLSPSVIRRSGLVTLVLEGTGLGEDTRVEVRRGSSPIPGIEVRRLRLRDGNRLRVTLYVAPDVPLGLYSLVAIAPEGGPSNSLGLEVSL